MSRHPPTPLSFRRPRPHGLSLTVLGRFWSKIVWRRSSSLAAMNVMVQGNKTTDDGVEDWDSVEAKFSSSSLSSRNVLLLEWSSNLIISLPHNDTVNTKRNENEDYKEDDDVASQLTLNTNWDYDIGSDYPVAKEEYIPYSHYATVLSSDGKVVDLEEEYEDYFQ